LASTFLHFFSNVASINENVKTNAPKDIDKNIEMNNNVPVPRVFNNNFIFAIVSSVKKMQKSGSQAQSFIGAVDQGTSSTRFLVRT
jgi:hypothetical protein